MPEGDRSRSTCPVLLTVPRGRRRGLEGGKGKAEQFGNREKTNLFVRRNAGDGREKKAWDPRPRLSSMPAFKAGEKKGRERASDLVYTLPELQGKNSRQDGLRS